MFMGARVCASSRMLAWVCMCVRTCVTPLWENEGKLETSVQYFISLLLFCVCVCVCMCDSILGKVMGKQGVAA